MRAASTLTALAVAATLYVAVFERDRLQAMLGAETDPATQSPQAAADPPGDLSAENGAAAPLDRASAAPAAGTAQPAADGAPGAEPVPVVAYDSRAASVPTEVSLRGETRAWRSVELRAETTGRVVSEPLRRGAAVQAGDTLCTLDPGTRPAMLAEARARLTEARISQTASSRLAEGGFASETQAAAAEAALQAAEAQVAAAEAELDRLEIRAPFDGLLEQDTAELGSLMQPGSPCATVLQLDPIRVIGYLPETLVAAVAPGAQAQIRLSDGRRIDGEVRYVARAADPATRTFEVEITAPNPDAAIRDGQSAGIRLLLPGSRAHALPASALTLDDAGTMGVRIVDEADRARFVPVQLLRDTPSGVLLTGLPERARVIVVGQEFVTDGVPVRVTLREGDT